ncbi:hypothetical protein AGMMS49944_23250 [Spirochaetia bacterium]|nr:hypothetical protein AGMMS49944_23250 [Spirochaetia bacterium]
MNSIVETGIIAAIIALAAAFVILRIARTFRSKRPSCCSGGGKVPVKGACRQGDGCPHCAGK